MTFKAGDEKSCLNAYMSSCFSLSAYVFVTGCISFISRLDNRVNSVMITHRWSWKYVSVNNSEGIIRDDLGNQGFRSARDSGWFCNVLSQV